MKMALLSRSLLPVVALLFVQLVVSRADERVEREIAKELKALEYDRQQLREIRVYNIINVPCDGVRHLRNAYKMLRQFELERERAITKLLTGPKEALTVPKIHTQMRKIHLAALDKVEPIAVELGKACMDWGSRSPEAASEDFVSVLEQFLKTRLEAREELRPSSYQPPDAWDETEVDFESDGQAAAIARAIEKERDALEEDQDHSINFSEYSHCTDIKEDVLDWDIERAAAINRVLEKKFDSAKTLRKALFDVHGEHLDKLEEYDETLRRGCGEYHRNQLLKRMETYLHKRQLEAIKGKTQDSDSDSDSDSDDD